jgi:hypothetical protein
VTLPRQDRDAGCEDGPRNGSRSGAWRLGGGAAQVARPAPDRLRRPSGPAVPAILPSIVSGLRAPAGGCRYAPARSSGRRRTAGLVQTICPTAVPKPSIRKS